MHTKTLFIIVLTITLCGCQALVDTTAKQQEYPFVGVWTIVSLKTISGEPVITIPESEEVDDFFHILTFHADGQWERIWGWTPASKPPVYFKTTGTYTLNDTRFTMVVEQSTAPNPVERRTGTWVRDGDTLTLIADTGVIIVLKDRL